MFCFLCYVDFVDLLKVYSLKQFNMSFYMTYLARWPDYFHVAEGPGNRVMGYSKDLFTFLISLRFGQFCLGVFRNVDSWILHCLLEALTRMIKN